MAKKNKPQEFIRITAKVDGFRRAGIEHYGTAEYPVSRFSKEQIAALKEEPLLAVAFFTVGEPEEKPAAENAPPAEPVGDNTDAENPAP